MTQELHLRSPAGSEAAVYRWPLTLTVFLFEMLLARSRYIVNCQ